MLVQGHRWRSEELVERSPKVLLTSVICTKSGCEKWNGEIRKGPSHLVEEPFFGTRPGGSLDNPWNMNPEDHLPEIIFPSYR
jgi:hypothetical protein